MADLQALRLAPEYHERVWGGSHLKQQAGGGQPIGEAWIVYEHNRVASGPQADKTLAELAERYGADLLGASAVERTGARFPILIKLLDCRQWLSLQVHPNDEQARRLEGPEHFGKTEAWYVIDAEQGAQIISGIKPGTTPRELATAIREGKLIDLAHYQPVKPGDVVLTRAGTVHALGPGLLIYEVQQTSDITYRIFDWDRPQQAGRALHIEQSVEVSDAAMRGEYRPADTSAQEGRSGLTSSEYFTLDLLHANAGSITLDPKGKTFHALTVIEGEMLVKGDGWSETLGQYDTLLVPACAGEYRVEPSGRAGFKALSASVE